MKIIYFYQYFTTPKGSWSTRAYEMARRWVEAGDSVTVITSLYDKSDLKPTGFITRLEIDGIDVRLINIGLSNKHGFITRILSFLAYALIASWYALRLPADVVVASSGPITVGLPGLLARYLRRIPMIFEVRDLWPEGAIQLGVLRNPFSIVVARTLERICYRAAACIVPLSSGMADWICQRYGCTHLVVVPNAADIQLFGTARDDIALPEWTKGKHLVLYTGTLGRMDDCRQIVNLAECLQQRADSRIEIVIIGDGADKQELVAEAARKGLMNLHFMGLLPKEELVGWLQRATCALLVFRNVPCLNTVSPNKMFDAFAAGIPVVQTTQGWIRDLLDTQQCGLTVLPNDAPAMADAVQLLVNDPFVREAMARNASRVAREEFDRDLLAERMRRCMQDATLGKFQ